MIAVRNVVQLFVSEANRRPWSCRMLELRQLRDSNLSEQPVLQPALNSIFVHGSQASHYRRTENGCDILLLVDTQSPQPQRIQVNRLVLNTLQKQIWKAAKAGDIQPRDIVRALNQASRRLLAQNKTDRQNTVASALVASVQNGCLLLKSVGNCRSYLLRHGIVRQLTRDQSLDHLVKSTANVSQRREHWPVLLLHGLGQHDFVANRSVTRLTLQPGDRLLFTTQAVADALLPTDLQAALQLSPTAAIAADTIRSTSNGESDSSVIVLVAGATPVE